MNLVRVPAILYLFTWIFGCRWLSGRAAHDWSVERRSFGDAFSTALSDARVPLSFLPVIGHWFAPRK